MPAKLLGTTQCNFCLSLQTTKFKEDNVYKNDSFSTHKKEYNV